jgi:putative transposase
VERRPGRDGRHATASALRPHRARPSIGLLRPPRGVTDYREHSDERVNSRNGYRARPWDTRVGTIDLAVPKLREGTYYPDWLLQPRSRAEQALTSVIAQACLEGVSTRRVSDLVKAMGIDGISKSQVSRLAADLDAKVAEFRNRPLDADPYRYLWIDALCQKVREGGRVVNVSA